MHSVSRIVVTMAALTAFAAGAEPAPQPAASPAAGQSAAPAAAPAKTGKVADSKDAVEKADPMVCERIQQIGSLLRSKKVCMRKSQWEEQRRSDRANIERSQIQRGLDSAN